MGPFLRRYAVALAVALIVAAGAIYRLQLAPGPGPAPAAGSTPLSDALGGGADDASGYARAERPRQFHFPADYGPHPDYRDEWWYFTGNLADASGRRFGYELTVFRIALSPTPRGGTSDWGTRQMYMAHFALTDVAADRFHAWQRFSRGAMGLAGAAAAPFHVWLNNWSIASLRPGRTFPVRLRAAEDDYAIELTLSQGKPVVLEGDHGLSRKSAAPGNASYYYSLTRMPTRGTVRLQGHVFHVQGASWMDREWSTSALGPDQSGWDWFALQLSDGREVMYYRLRDKDGGIDPYSSGTLIMADGGTRRLTPTETDLKVLDHWRSPMSGIRYPSRWRLRIPSQNLDVTVTPLIKAQELDLSVTYWEGAVKIDGRDQGQPVKGYGYLEMTGYGGSVAGRTH